MFVEQIKSVLNLMRRRLKMAELDSPLGGDGRPLGEGHSPDTVSMVDMKECYPVDPGEQDLS